MTEIEIVPKAEATRVGEVLAPSRSDGAHAAGHTESPWFPVLLSAGVFPGAGQWMQGHRVRAALFGGGSLIGLAAFMTVYAVAVQRLAVNVDDFAIDRVLSIVKDGLLASLWLLALPGLLWAAGVVDAVVVARRKTHARSAAALRRLR